MLDNYDAKCALFDSLKEESEVVKTAVFVKMLSSNYSDEELKVLSSGFAVVEKAITTVEKSLNYYNVAIKAYKDKI